MSESDDSDSDVEMDTPAKCAPVITPFSLCDNIASCVELDNSGRIHDN